MKRPSRRDQMIGNKQAHDFYAYVSGKPPMIEYDIPAKRQQRARGSIDGAPPLEREVLRDVWKYLAHHPKVAWVTRVNSGGSYFDNGKGGEQFMRFNYKKGMSDLIGQLKAAYGGRFLACECKREGAELEEHQRQFLLDVKHAGGVAFVARNITDCEDALK